MRTLLLQSIVLLAILVGLPLAAADADTERLKELDAFWAKISRAVKEGDFESYKSTCHTEGVLVAGIKKMSQPLSKALERWKHEFDDTKSGKIKASVEFRFSQRMGDQTTAHETGIFLYSSTDGGGKQEYIHFEVLLVKRDGWKTLMEYQKSKATREEWESLKSVN